MADPNLPFLLAQLINFCLLAGWPILAILALWQLRQRALDEKTRFGWALVILLIPILGALAFLLALPRHRMD